MFGSIIHATISVFLSMIGGFLKVPPFPFKEAISKLRKSLNIIMQTRLFCRKVAFFIVVVL